MARSAGAVQDFPGDAGLLGRDVDVFDVDTDVSGPALIAVYDTMDRGIGRGVVAVRTHRLGEDRAWRAEKDC